jgi:hypothetical protein
VHRARGVLAAAESCSTVCIAEVGKYVEETRA